MNPIPTPKRIIFLDYDGVLNDPRFLIDFHSEPGKHSGKDSLDPKRIAILKHLCNLCDAQIVLTSAWRDDMETRKFLKQKWQLPIIGATPHCHDHRGKEINQWLKDSKFDGQWIIIDDECSDLDDIQREHLIYTREGYFPSISSSPTLGLRKKHILFAKALFFRDDFPTQANSTFLDAILSAIENDLLRVMWNINQAEYDDLDPFQNTGNVEGFKTDNFEVHAYDWNWDYDDNHPVTPQPINFQWRDFKLTWYKYMGRGMHWNRPISHSECAQMLEECLDSLRKYEQEHDDFYKEVS